MSEEKDARWMRAVLLAAAAYNVLWGTFVVLFPLALFRVLGMELPNYRRSGSASA